jgi:hypothetical protein
MINIFVMFLGIMTGKNLSTELCDLSKTPNKSISRYGNGPLDYLLMNAASTYCKALVVLFLKQFWTRACVKGALESAGDLFRSTLDANYFNAIVTAIIQQKRNSMLSTSRIESELAARVKSAITGVLASEESSKPTVSSEGNNELSSVKGRDDMKTDEDYDGEPPAVIIHQFRQHYEESDESESDEEESPDGLWEPKPSPLLDHSLGQLSMQMMDCIKMHCSDIDSTNDGEGNPTNKRRRTLPLTVKGILSTGQTSLFFEMKKYPHITQPEFSYMGMSGLDYVFPKQGNQIHSQLTDQIINTDDVSRFLMQHCAFITRDTDK